MKKNIKEPQRKVIRINLNDEKEAKLADILDKANGFQTKLLAVMAEEFIDTFGEIEDKDILKKLVDNYEFIKSIGKKSPPVVMTQKSMPAKEDPTEEENDELDSALGGFNY